MHVLHIFLQSKQVSDMEAGACLVVCIEDFLGRGLYEVKGVPFLEGGDPGTADDRHVEFIDFHCGGTVG